MGVYVVYKGFYPKHATCVFSLSPYYFCFFLKNNSKKLQIIFGFHVIY